MILWTTTPLYISQSKTGQAVVAEHVVGTGMETIAMVIRVEVIRIKIIGEDMIGFIMREVAFIITEGTLPCIAICAINLRI